MAAEEAVFMSDALDTRFMTGHGPAYSVKEISKAKGVPYWQLAFEQLNAHVTQYKTMLAQLASLDAATRERVAVGDTGGDALIEPLRLVRAKSDVGGTAEGDIFEGITPAPIPLVRWPREQAARPALALRVGGPWQFYRDFWQAHALPALTMSADGLIGPVDQDEPVSIPLLVINGTDRDAEVQVGAALPQGWHEGPRSATVLVAAGAQVEIVSVVTPADAGQTPTARPHVHGTRRRRDPAAGLRAGSGRQGRQPSAVAQSDGSTGPSEIGASAVAKSTVVAESSSAIVSDPRSWLSERNRVLLALFLLLIPAFALTALTTRAYRREQQRLAAQASTDGEIALRHGRAGDAVVALRTAMSLAATRSRRLRLAQALAAAGRDAEARAHLLTLREGTPGDGLINLELARLAARDADVPHAARYAS